MANGSCLLFLGPEIGEKQEAIEDIRRRLTRAAQAAPEETSFYAGETPVQDMVAVLRNRSLFAEERLICIKNAEVLKKKEDLEGLAAYLESPQEHTTLILISEATSLAKALETPIPAKNKRVFWELFENRKQEWVASFFKRQGFTISTDGIETILELVENNTDALRRECSRLTLFLGKEGVTGEEVEKWLSHTREESAFTLFSRISAGDFAKSLASLHTLLGAQESPVAILAGLAWCFRKLRDYLGLLASGGAASELDFKKIGLASPKARKDYERASRRYDLLGVDTCLSLIGEYDILVRSGGMGLETLLMDLFLYKIMRTGRR
ncbi:MAG: DNA polymerase III subunit delta [Treponema sp.]|jgi:DNA polymerase-3 subunit delta|nr:DNA polymerase III subunit delta [Treponema sp.]